MLCPRKDEAPPILRYTPAGKSGKRVSVFLNAFGMPGIEFEVQTSSLRCSAEWPSETSARLWQPRLLEFGFTRPQRLIPVSSTFTDICRYCIKPSKDRLNLQGFSDDVDLRDFGLDI